MSEEKFSPYQLYLMLKKINEEMEICKNERK
jgi:hypothetical protein